MAETFNNARLSIAGNSLTDLYAVPAATQATAHVVVTNQTATAATYSVAVAPLGAASAVSHFIGYSSSVGGSAAVDLKGLILKATDVVRVDGSTNTLSFNLFAIEVT